MMPFSSPHASAGVCSRCPCLFWDIFSLVSALFLPHQRRVMMLCKGAPSFPVPSTRISTLSGPAKFLLTLLIKDHLSLSINPPPPSSVSHLTVPFCTVTYQITTQQERPVAAREQHPRSSRLQTVSLPVAGKLRNRLADFILSSHEFPSTTGHLRDCVVNLKSSTTTISRPVTDRYHHSHDPTQSTGSSLLQTSI